MDIIEKDRIEKYFRQYRNPLGLLLFQLGLKLTVEDWTIIRNESYFKGMRGLKGEAVKRYKIERIKQHIKDYHE